MDPTGIALGVKDADKRLLFQRCGVKVGVDRDDTGPPECTELWVSLHVVALLMIDRKSAGLVGLRFVIEPLDRDPDIARDLFLHESLIFRMEKER